MVPEAVTAGPTPEQQQEGVVYPEAEHGDDAGNDMLQHQAYDAATGVSNISTLEPAASSGQLLSEAEDDAGETTPPGSPLHVQHGQQQEQQQEVQQEGQPEVEHYQLPQPGGGSDASSPVSSSKRSRLQHGQQPAWEGKEQQLVAAASPTSSHTGSLEGLNELGSPSSVFLPHGSLASSLQFQAAPAGGARLHHAGAGSSALASPPPGRLSYSALQLRCQALEVALEQQSQRTDAVQAALAAAHSQHAAEESSLRQYYEAQLADKQHELSLLMQHMAAAAARAESTATADGGGSTVVIGAEESLAATSLEAHASPLAPQQQVPAAAGAGGARPLSPAVAAGAGLGLGLPASTASGSVAGSSVSLTDVALLRRELGQAEGLIKAYQAENKAAAKRIKEVESQLAAARAEIADEAGRAQRAAAAAAEVQRASGAAAADRLARQLQLEGQLQQMQASWQEREQQLMSQIEALRRDKAAAEARAAAAVEGHDMARWQAEDGLVAELRSQMADQADAHAAQLQLMQDKLTWYAENQALLGSADQLVAEQADLIRQLEARLLEAEGAAGRSQAARIAELQQQVVALQEALASRHPSSLPALLAAAKPGPGEAAALAQAAATIRQLESQLEQQQQVHEHGLRQLQQHYEALKARLEQRSAAQQATGGGPKSRMRELTQQLEDQRSMYTRRIRALEAKLTAAEGAAAAASRQASSSSTAKPASSTGTTPAGHRPATGATARLRRSNQANQHAGDSSDGAPASHCDAAADVAAAATCSEVDEQVNAGPADATAAVAGSTGRRAVVSGLLHVKERQMAGLVAQLEERTSQFLQLQQKYRAAERQLKALTAAQQQHPDRDSSGSPPASGHARTKAGGAAGRPDTSAVPDASPHRQSAAELTVGGMSPQRTRRVSTSGGDATGSAAGAASWPALCAELESENEQLKVALAEARRLADDREHQVADLTARLNSVPHGQQHTATLPPLPGVAATSAGLPGLPPAPYLLSLVQETAAREAARWEAHVAALQEMLRASQDEAAGLAQELAVARAKGGAWSPSIAAFEALERKINSLEAAAAVQQMALQQQQQQQKQLGLLASLGLGPQLAPLSGATSGLQPPGTEVVAAITQQYEAALAAKNAELQGFQLQLEALLEAAHELQKQQQEAAGSSAVEQQQH